MGLTVAKPQKGKKAARWLAQVQLPKGEIVLVRVPKDIRPPRVSNSIYVIPTASGAYRAVVYRKPPNKKKIAPAKSIKIGHVDYKDTATLRKFISERGKIRARRVTGLSVRERRMVAKAIEDAREDVRGDAHLTKKGKAR